MTETPRPCSFRLKPLRERSEDIPDLVNLCAGRLARRLGRGEIVIQREMLESLVAYDWLENFDELEGVLESAIRHAPPLEITEAMLPPRVRFAGFHRIPEEGISLREAVEQFEKSLITAALQQTGGVQTRAAQLLGLRLQTLSMKLKRSGSRRANGAR